jgi:GDP-L-fucose synthase
VFNLMCFKGSIKTIREKPVNFMVYTILPSMQLTRAAHEQGIEKFLYTSTLGVYGPAQVWNEDDVLDENNVLLNPPKVYAFGAYPKLFGELEARAYNEQHGWDISIVRPASVYGPGDNFDPGNAMVIASLTGQAMEGVNPLQVWGDGSEVRDFVHAEDVARGMMLVLEKSPGPYKPVNLGGGKETTIKELAETIARTTPNKPKIDWDTTKPTGDKRRFLDISRARSLGWEPQISLEQGIEDLVTWYGQNRDKIKRKDDLL